MTLELTDTVLRVVERAPQWIRRDLDAKDTNARIRAEESLAAMIADALGNETDATVQRRSAALHAIEVPDQAASASERVRRRGSPLHGDSGTA